MNRDAIDAGIREIGAEMVTCRFGGACAEVENAPDRGSPPRCLFIYPPKQPVGVVVVGLNPGTAKRREQDFYASRGASYDRTVEWVISYLAQSGLRNRSPYYRRLLDLVHQLGLEGAVLWTELVKCQMAEGHTRLGVRTLRRCTATYLRRELALVPDAPIVAAGSEAYRAVAYLFPDRLVIGVRHPTGARNWPELQDAVARNASQVRNLLTESRDRSSEIHGDPAAPAIWLPDVVGLGKSPERAEDGGDRTT